MRTTAPAPVDEQPWVTKQVVPAPPRTPQVPTPPSGFLSLQPPVEHSKFVEHEAPSAFRVVQLPPLQKVPLMH